MIADVEVHVSAGVPRGKILMHWRDYEDAFTYRPTRSDFELWATMDAASKLEALIQENKAIPLACSECGGLWAAEDLEDGLCLPCTVEDDFECMECGDPWSDTELDDDGRCWACAARIRNEGREA